MKIGIMQPYFFPYIGYWQLINAVDKYVIYDDVNYIKGGWINRNRILMNDEPQMINLRMRGASCNKMINQIEVLQDEIYKRKLLTTCKMCYKNAPYFYETFAILNEILNENEINLAKFLKKSMKKICRYIGIETKLILSSDLKKNSCLKGEQKVIEICKILNATEYYNAVGGQKLYSYEDFKKENIVLKFLDTRVHEYKQFGKEFVPNLSIIDVMMFNSVEEIRYMLSLYKLIQEENY